MQIGLALLTGLVLGMVFAYFKLPIPAPISIAGVMGVVGVTMGYLLINHFIA